MGSSQRFWLLLVVLVLVAEATSSPTQCSCAIEVHTLRCSGCSRLPQIIPAGVSRLNMSGNRVSRVYFDASISPTLPDLKSVILDTNDIVALREGELCPLKNLMVLDLSDNNLLSIEEESITCNSQLKQLVLDNNPRLKLVALRSQSLEHLYLQNCGLTSFDAKLLNHLPNLLGLHLRGNDALPSQVVQDIRKRRPDLNVYCDDKPSATKNASTTITVSSETSIDNKTNTSARLVTSDDRPSQVPIPPANPTDVLMRVVVYISIIVGACLVALFIFSKKPCSDVQSCQGQPLYPN